MKKYLEAFLVSYQKSFDQFNASAIGTHYVLPCLIADVDGLKCYDNAKQLQHKFVTNVESMKDLGYSGSSLLIKSIKKLGKDKAMLDVLWTVNLKTGPYEFGTLYLCQKQQEDWLIFNATVYDQ